MAGGFRNPKDFGSGLLFALLGGCCVAMAQKYPMGSAKMMGPGYFPAVLGSLLALNGAALIVRSFMRSGSGVWKVSWRGMLLILAAIVLFGLLLKTAGLPIAVMALVLISACASAEFRFWPSLALAVALSVFCVLVFVQALGLPIPLLGSWFPD
jgi:hypothetical protein